jgi:putative flippase GtrA
VIGFLVDALVLTALTALAGWSPFSARVVSFGCAVSATWYLNRRFTFPGNIGEASGREYVKYVFIQGIGATINLAVYATMLMIFEVLRSIPVIALATGSIIAMMFNFLALRRFVYSQASTS